VRTGGLHILAVGAALATLHGEPGIAALPQDPTTLRAISQDFGKCIVNKRRLKPIAVRFVLYGETRDARLIINFDCFGTVLDENMPGGERNLQARWSQREFRALVADGLVQSDFAASGPTDFSAIPALNHEPGITRASDGSPLSSEQMQGEVALATLGECAARRDPEGVRLMAQTAVGTPEELTSLRQLAPAFGACMKGGQTLEFPRAVLRQTAVVAYARLAYSLPGASQEVHY
jgi:hypothetical protein